MKSTLRLLAVAVCSLLASSTAYAVEGPSPSAATPSKVTLPDGPASVRGLGGTADVSAASAQVAYSVSIEVPDGGGVAPSVSLSYHGDLGNGPVGVGWMLAHASIRRSTRRGVPSYDDADEIEITGVGSGRLIRRPDGSYALEGAPYALRVERTGNRWKITDSNGVVYYFGLTTASRQEDTVGGALRTVAWFPELVVHLNGRTINYEYLHHHGQVYLSRVTWGVGGKYGLEVNYENRRDPVLSYRDGFSVETAYRIHDIRVRSGASTLRRYELHYDDLMDARVALSRLSRVHMTGFQGDGAMPDLSFAYAPRSAGTRQVLSGTDGWALNARGVSLFDVDGDGMEDLLRLEMGNQEFRKNLGGAFGPEQSLTGPSVDLAQVQLMDVDGDARGDLVRVVDDTWRWYRLEADSTWSAQGEWPGTQGLPLHGAGVLADLNGDGRTDLIRGTAVGVLVNLATATGMADTLSLPRISPSDVGVEPGAANIRFADINGDGLSDVVWLTDAWMKQFLGRGDGTFSAWRRVFYPWGTSPIDLKNTFVSDLDRDGLADLARIAAGHVAFYPARADGSFDLPRAFERPEAAEYDAVVTIADGNGNGSADIVWSSPRGMWLLDLAGATTAGMLTQIDNGVGETTSFAFQGSAILSVAAEQSQQRWKHKLPVSIPVPVRSDVHIVGCPTRTSQWGVRDGFWDGAERRFGGFLETSTVVAGNFARDTAVSRVKLHEGMGDERVLRGRPITTRVENGLGEILTETTVSWDAYRTALSGDDALLRVPVARSTVTSHHEGVQTPVKTASFVVVDIEGRPVEEYNAGRIDMSGDETLIARRYASNDELWIRDRVWEERVLPGDGGAPLSLVRHYFGGTGTGGVQPLGDIGLGLVRRTEAWLDEEDRWVEQESTEYDARWNPSKVTASGIPHAFAYDPSGEYLRTETVGPDDIALTYSMTWDEVRSLATGMTDPNTVQTRIAYDALDRVTSVGIGDRPAHVHYAYDWTAPRPTTRTYAFAGPLDGVGAFPGSFTVGLWREAATVTNGAGEPLFSAIRANPSQWIVSGWKDRDARGRTTQVDDAFYWDNESIATVVPPADVPYQTVSYDAFDRVVLQVLPTGARKSIAFRAFETTVSSDGLAPVTSYFDGQDRILRTQRVLDGSAQSVDATYDAMGRITAMRLQRDQANQLDHQFTYDTLGRLVFATDPDIGDRNLLYDDAGHLIEHTNAAGQTITLSYDTVGRLASRTADDVSFTFHYDHPMDAATFPRTNGRLAWVQEPTGQVQVGYDELGRATRSRRTINSQSADVLTTYSAGGSVLAVNYQDGVELDLSYDDAGRLIAVEDFWAADGLDAAGRVLRERYGNGVVTTYARDSLGQATDIAVLRAGSTAIYQVHVDRNAYGAITAVDDRDDRGLNHDASFTYDSGGRLTGATIGAASEDHSFSYAYDSLQNMVSRAGAARGTLVGTYLYGEPRIAGGPLRGPRQLTTVVTTSGPVAFDYDAAGRQIQQGTVTLEYNGLDQLIRVDGVPGVTGDVLHSYGYDGLRVYTRSPSGDTQVWFTQDLSQTDGSRQHYVRVGERLVARVDLSWTGEPDTATTSPSFGALTRDDGASVNWAALTFTALFGLLVIAAVMPRPWRGKGMMRLALAYAATLSGCGIFGTSSHTLWQHEKTLYYHQGIGAGPSLITRADGSILEERRFEPFGDDLDAYHETSSGSDVGLIDFLLETHGLLNKPTDVTTGWSYHGARWQAPETARWLTPDPPVKAPDAKFMQSPWSLHPYQYVEQNPILFWDPDGRDPERFLTTNTPDTHGYYIARPRNEDGTYQFDWTAYQEGMALVQAQVAEAYKPVFIWFRDRAVAGYAQNGLSGAINAISPVYNLMVNIYQGIRAIDEGRYDDAVSYFALAAVDAYGVYDLAVTGGAALRPASAYAGKILCFPEGTAVIVPGGTRPIEALKVGDDVVSYDFDTDRVVVKKITRVFHGETQWLIEIRLEDGHTIRATRFHPFWVEGVGWQDALDLKAGMRLRTVDGAHVEVLAVTASHLDDSVRTYNLEVDELHVYFAGDRGILVHNQEAPTPQQLLDIKHSNQSAHESAKVIQIEQAKRARKFLKEGGILGVRIDIPVGDPTQPGNMPHAHGGGWSVNIDGSPHDGPNKREIPKAVKKALLAAGWDC
jgi:RHS repeat-associated protein